MSRTRSLLALSLLLGLLTACGGKASDAGGPGDGQTDALPAPEAGRSGVTGMPDKPGPGQIGAPATGATPGTGEVAVDENGQPLPVADGSTAPASDAPASEGGTPPSTGTAPPDGNALPEEPTPQDAVAVVRSYYAAINERQFAQAYALWSDGGKASKQTEQQFADGFRDTASVQAETLAPGRADAGAGQRYIEVPVALTATQRDGSQRRYVGAYTLHRTVVDGATAEQRAWRIRSADIREVKQ